MDDLPYCRIDFVFVFEGKPFLDIEVRRVCVSTGEYILFTETIPLYRGNDFPIPTAFKRTEEEAEEKEEDDDSEYEPSVPSWDVTDPYLKELLEEEEKEYHERRKQRASKNQNSNN